MKRGIFVSWILIWASTAGAKLTSTTGAAFPQNSFLGDPVSLVANLISDSPCTDCTVVFYLLNSSGARKHEQIFNGAEFYPGALHAFGYNLLLDERFEPGIYSVSMVIRDARGVLVDKKTSFLQFRVHTKGAVLNDSKPRMAGS